MLAIVLVAMPGVAEATPPSDAATGRAKLTVGHDSKAVKGRFVG